jgi:hypothetical protein
MDSFITITSNIQLQGFAYDKNVQLLAFPGNVQLQAFPGNINDSGEEYKQTQKQQHPIFGIFGSQKVQNFLTSVQVDISSIYWPPNDVSFLNRRLLLNYVQSCQKR